jgi:hypothetical protein
MELRDIIQLVELGQYRFSEKVNDLLDDERFSEDDIVCCVTSATRISKKQRDEQGTAKDGYKYTIVGKDLRGNSFYTAGKIFEGNHGTIYFFITAHHAR